MNKIAIIIPCHNEETAIYDVVTRCNTILPAAAIVVIDNNSTDNTAKEALRAGAQIITQPMQGKGHAIRKAFSDIDAAIYCMIDGDGTYDTSALPAMLKKFKEEQSDMLVGVRVEAEDTQGDLATYRRGHRLGNTLFNTLFSNLFGKVFSDIFSGYRIFSRRYVRSFPVTATGFDIETEMAVHAVFLSMNTAEYPTTYSKRAEGSESKLSTYKDGIKILYKMIRLYQGIYPLRFYGIIALLFFLSGLAVGYLPVMEFIRTGYIDRVPSAILAATLESIAFTFLITSLILHNISKMRKENRYLNFLNTTP